MRPATEAACATVAWAAPVLVWVGAGLWADAAREDGAAQAARRLAPLLPVVQMFVLSLLLPALTRRRPWRHIGGMAALLVTACWPAVVLIAQTDGVGYRTLAAGQAVVAGWALVAVAVSALAADRTRNMVPLRPVVQAVLTCGAVALAGPLHAALAGGFAG